MVPNLVSDFRKFEKIVSNYKNNNVIDLSHESFLAPTTLLPILHFGNKINAKYHVNNQSGEYVKKVLGLTKNTNTTIPFTEITNQNRDLTMDFYNLFPKDFNNFADENTSLFLIEEMINNIVDHSDFTIAHTLAQHYPLGNVVDICFIDNGISIPGKFEQAGFDFSDDNDAINQAINGKSTKKDEGLRGTGLNNVINLITKGNGGSVLIASRNGLIHIIKNKKYKLNMRNNINKGTLISIRLKMKIVDIENFYSYVNSNIKI